MRIVVFSLVLFLAAPFIGCGAEHLDKGTEIAIEADKRSSGFTDYIVKMTMILRNRDGNESRREMRSEVLETSNDGDKSLTIFDTPRNVKGTAMLTITHKTGDDDQWLYLPALKRVKRISSTNKSGSFMGSEFSYEDLGSREVEKYDYHYLRDEECGAGTCFVLELTPKDTKNSGYSHIFSWLDHEHYRAIKEEYYDRKSRLLKTLFLEEYKQYLGFHWRPSRMNMINHQNGKQTDLLFEQYSFKNGLTDSDFSKSSLQRVR